MFCAFIGRRGSGKSYEMVRYHVLELVKAGRMVVTNLSLNLDEIYAVYPEARNLIIIKKPTKSNPVPFRMLEDFMYDWRHPETGQGPCLIVDEAHKAFPSGRTSIDVLEFLAESRHAGLDLYVATQGMRKLDKDLIDMIDMTYRLIKARAFGSTSHYIRKVIDGTRGEVFNTTPRKYDPAYYRFYKSHTKSDAAVQELETDSDIKPIWMRWPFIGSAICFVGFIVMLSLGWLNPFAMVEASAKAVNTQKPVYQDHPEPPAMAIKETTPNQLSTVSSIQGNQPEEIPRIEHPYSKVRLHVAGDIERDGNRLISFKASQNGQHVFYLNSQDLKDAGYDISYNSTCSVDIAYGVYTEALTCDTPTVSMRSVSGPTAN